MDNSYRRNPGFDCLRLLCAFCVVCLHVAYPFKYLAEPWIRFAVPVFFMLSGFFFQGQRHHGKQIRKILVLCIGANLFHFVFLLALNALTGHSSAAFLGSLVNIQVWMDFLLLNQSPISSPLWYLGALVYVLVLVSLLGDRRTLVYPLIPVLLILNLVLGTYSPVVFGRPLSIEISRNFLFVGLPFFLLGDYLRRRESIPEWKMLFSCLALGLALSFGENYLLHKAGLLVNQDFYFGTVFVAYALFRMTQRGSAMFENALCRKAALWGRRYSLGIYILHPMVIQLCKAFLSRFGDTYPLLSRAYILFAPLIVFSLSLLLSAVCYQKRE